MNIICDLKWAKAVLADHMTQAAGSVSAEVAAEIASPVGDHHRHAMSLALGYLASHAMALLLLNEAEANEELRTTIPAKVGKSKIL